jgi:anti-sigma regulatory factor (Ser/Thr protein kinase)
MYELNILAKVANLDEVIAFLDDIMEKHQIAQKIRTQLDIAVEEIFVNIAHYGYPKEDGTAQICVTLENNCFFIRFRDQGTPYDPLQKKDPDITLSADDRPIGGLGIFMVKKSMDDVSYEYKDGCNVLLIKKQLLPAE